MPDASVITGVVFEDAGASLMSRVVGNDAANVTQASLTAIAYKVYDTDVPGTAASSGALVIATVVFDTLQTDARWTEDATGYNFRWDVPASVFADGNKIYRIEIVFDPVSGEDFVVVFNVSTLGLLGS